MNLEFWRARRVFITGHTGFKGSWLAFWLKKNGTHVTAFSLAPPTKPSLFETLGVAEGITSVHGDIRDYSSIRQALQQSNADTVFHLAAQATVSGGYSNPRDTFATNLTGTLNLLDAIRETPSVRSAVIVTSDKCYAPIKSWQPLDEESPMGGYDPYSASKSCAEIAVNAWRESFFGNPSSPRIATARAGNVIGGGDWSAHRLLPDLVRAFTSGQPISLRMPAAVRPWQHVLDALHGYLLLAEKLSETNGIHYARGWNFGPDDSDHRSVAEVAEAAATRWGVGPGYIVTCENFQKESHELRLDNRLARRELGWKPRWRLHDALHHTIDWYRAALRDEDMHVRTLSQLDNFLNSQ